LIVVPKNQVNYAQLEEAPTPSSYILTTTSTATRAGETLTIPSANLPWPEPVVIGEELVTNGTFDTDTDWTKGTGWTISDGVVSSTTDGEFLSASVGSLTIGKTYRVSFDISSYTSGTARFYSGGFLGIEGSAVGTVAGVFTAQQTAVQIYSSAFVGSIDNVSVREINPLAVSIAMEGTMTYADNNSSTEETLYRWQADANNNINAWVRTDTTPNKILFWVIESGNAVLVDGGSLSSGLNVPFNIASRHGSTFINGAVDGTALTENTTPVALPDLSTTDLQLGSTFMGTIKTFRVWADDISDVGIEEASS
jgi:hypothetical protein